MDTPRNMTSILLGLSFALLVAFAVVSLTYRGYVEDAVPETIVWAAFCAGWLVAALGAFMIATLLGSHQALATGVTLFAWIPIWVIATVMLLMASCAGIGPRSCGFS